MTKQNSAVNSKNRPEVLAENYGIKNTAYYQRIKFLKIKPEKGGDGKTYLSDKQVKMMDALHEYIAKNGKMEGFEFTPGGNEVESESVAPETDDVNDNDDSSGKMTVAASGKISGPDSVIEQEIPQTQPDFSQGMEGIMRKAAELTAQGLAMPDLVALQLSSQMTFDDLPDDLKDKVTAVREAATPKMQPAETASQLLAQYRASRQ